MTLIEEIFSFSVEYCNSKKERTITRKKKIRAAYKEVFEREMRGSCPTCYLEAMLEIVRSFKNINIMATPNYELKRGVLLQAFDHPEKACTNKELTDELAEWYLKNYPEKAIYFSKIPNVVIPVTPRPLQPEVIVIPPAPRQPEPADMIAGALNGEKNPATQKDITVRKPNFKKRR